CPLRQSAKEFPARHDPRSSNNSAAGTPGAPLSQKHKQTWRKRMTRNNFLLLLVYRAPGTKAPSSRLARAPRRGRCVPESPATARVPDHPACNKAAYPPAPSCTSRCFAPKNSETLPSLYWPTFLSLTRPTHDKEVHSSRRGYGSRSA